MDKRLAVESATHRSLAWVQGHVQQGASLRGAQLHNHSRSKTRFAYLDGEISIWKDFCDPGR